MNNLIVIEDNPPCTWLTIADVGAYLKVTEGEWSASRAISPSQSRANRRPGPRAPGGLCAGNPGLSTAKMRSGTCPVGCRRSGRDGQR